MTNMRNLPVDHFDGHANLTQHQKNAAGPTLAEQMGLIYDDVEEINSDIDTLNEPLTEYTRYVDCNAPAGGNGSIHRPYQTIQAAVDDVEAISAISPAWSIFRILIGPGWYYEDIVISGGKDDDYLHIEGDNVWTSPTTDGVIVSNATPASIAAWKISRNDADLAAHAVPIKGWGQIYINGIVLGKGTESSFSALGVVGDASPTKTEFGVISFENCSITGFGTTTYFRNTRLVQFDGNLGCGSIVAYNFGGIIIRGGYASALALTYDATDPLGEVDSVTVGEVSLRNASCGNTTLSGTAFLDSNGAVDSEFRGTLYLDGSGSSGLCSSIVHGAVTVTGAASLDARGCRFLGNLTAASGAGVVALNDSPILGSLTDPDDKVTMTRAGVRAGTVTAAGAGDEAIVFASTLGTTRYIITITQEDSGAGATTAVVKSGTKAATGFTMTVGGAGIFHWKAEMLTA